MKALSIIQPWATLIAIGAKRIETRAWFTDYRGPLAIHASKWRDERDQTLNVLEWELPTPPLAPDRPEER